MNVPRDQTFIVDNFCDTFLPNWPLQKWPLQVEAANKYVHTDVPDNNSEVRAALREGMCFVEAESQWNMVENGGRIRFLLHQAQERHREFNVPAFVQHILSKVCR